MDKQEIERGIKMQKEELFQHVHSMITSSTKKPKYMSISSVKMANLYGVSREEIENGLQDLVKEGSLQKSSMDSPPYHEIYLLP
ncbi:hypothetical protein RCG23_22605 [Neobacillus sp. PS3-34]|uniref:hypothetical protein n=1 Tax=Neobacillus sp. PS3-34 TaxID=3070678 RepID=UPI0027E15220|nr:hypothetical protein [Neobacillus sp. PS3-34]WML48047.1 hypothetical protein RCG23_22605 [Neobacillus sp. PS3-34]